ncbi:MAG: fimbrillin family protein, partial [Phocaeicola sp.]
MNKLFLLPIVTLALAASSCTKHDVLNHTPSEDADPLYVNFNAYTGRSKATSTTAETFKEFYVYGYQGINASDEPLNWDTSSPKLLMKDEKVTKASNNVWQTASLNPWPAKGTHVQFFAFSPAASTESGIEYVKDDGSKERPALSFTAKTDVAQQVDLLYAQSDEMSAAAAGSHSKVFLNFTHALTKVKFSAKVQPKQRAYISEISLHNLGSKGSF